MKWSLVPLEALCDLASGGTPHRDSPNYYGGPIAWAKIADLGAPGSRVVQTAETITEEGLAAIGGRIFPEGSILLAMYGSVGKVAIAGRLMSCNQAILGIQVRDKERLFAGFLRWWLDSIRPRLEREARGVTQKNLSATLVGALRIPLPPRSEQRRIAAILDKADAVRRKRQEAIRLAEDLLRSAFLEMFGDPVHNPKGWPTVNLGKLLPAPGAIVDGPFGSSLKPDCYVGSGVRVIRNYNIKDDCFDASGFKYVTREKFEDLRRSSVEPDDVLLSTKGTIGNVCLMPGYEGPSLLSASGTVRIRLDAGSGLEPAFLVSQMIAPSFKRQIVSLQAGSNQKYLNLTAIRAFRIAIPPLPLQRRYLELREAVHCGRARQLEGRDSCQRLFASLERRAFQGTL